MHGRNVFNQAQKSTAIRLLRVSLCAYSTSFASEFTMMFAVAFVFAASLALGQGKATFQEDFIEEIYNGECFYFTKVDISNCFSRIRGQTWNIQQKI